MKKIATVALLSVITMSSSAFAMTEEGHLRYLLADIIGGDNLDNNNVLIGASGIGYALAAPAIAQSNSVDKRIGAFREDEIWKRNRLWVRGVGRADTIDDITKVQINTAGAEVGYDQDFKTKYLPGHLIFGVMGGYSSVIKAEADSNFTDNDADGNAYHVGAYGIYRDHTGWFGEITFRQFWNTIDNTMIAGTAPMSAEMMFTGKASSTAIGAEIGKEFKLDDSWRIDPRIEFNYINLQSGTADLDVPIAYPAPIRDAVRWDSINFMTGKIGAILTYKSKYENGFWEPYFILNLVNEFDGKSHVSITTYDYDSDIGGLRVQGGVGFNWAFNRFNTLYGQATYEYGDVYQSAQISLGYKRVFSF